MALPPVDIRFIWFGLAGVIPGASWDISGGAGGVKFPDWRRVSSAWFNSLATLLPCGFGNRLG